MSKGKSKEKERGPGTAAGTSTSVQLSATLIGAITVAFAMGAGLAGRFASTCTGKLDGLHAAACGAIGMRTLRVTHDDKLAASVVPRVASDPWVHTTHPGMATEGWNWTQLSMSRAGNFRDNDIKRYTADMVRREGAMWVWHTTFARSIPAVVQGLGSEIADPMRGWKVEDFRRRWGQNNVVVAFSDHENFNRGVADPEYGRLVRHPDRVQHSFADFLDLSNNPAPGEHVSVQQSPSRDFSEWGLPGLPPLLEELVKYTINARNFWAAAPPKVSVLHYDWQDSVLLQLSGTKRFTIIDPARLHTAYPCVAYLQQLKRVAPGKFETIITSRELDNFPLLNVTHPDRRRHPLYDVHEPACARSS